MFFLVSGNNNARLQLDYNRSEPGQVLQLMFVLLEIWQNYELDAQMQP